MTTLGQRLRTNREIAQGQHVSAQTDPLALEAARRLAVKNSLTSVIAKAKEDFANAINSGSEIASSRVNESEPAYEFLLRVDKNQYAPYDALLRPLWTDFVDWARTEDLAIRLNAVPSFDIAESRKAHLNIHAWSRCPSKKVSDIG